MEVNIINIIALFKLTGLISNKTMSEYTKSLSKNPINNLSSIF